MSLLVLMGSGETAPAMVRIHREVLERVEATHPVILDTPFGFQVNADQLVTRTATYFQESVGVDVDVASWRSHEVSAADKRKALALLGGADWVFCGPGSPTYALTQWAGSEVPATFTDVLERGGALVLGSAAAVTAGSHALPVYEIYKVGQPPQWVDGLNLMSVHSGLDVAVIPHFNNAEGGSYDTRFCYLGEQRLSALEGMLPDSMSVLGVDEHTAVIFDLSKRCVEVKGNGVLTIRRLGQSTTFPAGTVMPIEELASIVAGTVTVDPPPAAHQRPGVSGQTRSAEADHVEQLSLGADEKRLRERFEEALARKDVDGCVGAIIDLEQAIHDWATDMLQSDESDKARRTLRSMVVRLGELARVGARDPQESVAPLVDAMLRLRARAREHRDFATGDAIRDELTAAGVEVKDSPSGTSWNLTS